MSTTTHSGNSSSIQTPDFTRKPFQRAILIVHTIFGHIDFSSGHTQTALFIPISALFSLPTPATEIYKIKGVQQ